MNKSILSPNPGDSNTVYTGKQPDQAKYSSQISGYSEVAHASENPNKGYQALLSKAAELAATADSTEGVQG